MRPMRDTFYWKQHSCVFCFLDLQGNVYKKSTKPTTAYRSIVEAQRPVGHSAGALGVKAGAVGVDTGDEVEMAEGGGDLRVPGVDKPEGDGRRELLLGDDPSE